MHRLILAAAIAVALTSCASAPVVPTPHKPIRACAFSCPNGRFLFDAQHLCNVGRRWLRDIWIVGEFANAIASWIGCDQPPGLDGKCEEVVYRKIDVEFGTCSEAQTRIIAARDASKRGVYPGEDDHGRRKERP